ncbi:MopE-related protein [Flavobacterium dankookense]|uniref:Putative secreted protein (Por secretion system target) n=1 Tax=Flavobacterium dankookense TaxID=706186 RepID=A0A4R6QAV6_9FLAO|nr:MopE-related protein [Flavobacterium dankookense]TDP58399.1 putative secreted protein (Por secretion system target) [Flavobacterium dankookense]
MKRFLHKGLLCSFFVSASLFSVDAIAQNIFSGEPVQVVGSFNGYATTPYNSDYRTTSFRRVSVSTGTPTDGRGQWATTINVQPSGGNVTPINMLGGGGNGFLFISGPSGSRFQNKWVFDGIGQGALNAVNGTVYNTGNDMGLNMSTAGRYTFVMNDVGYTGTNSRYYVGYTTNAPVTVSRTSQSFNLTQTVVNITTSATPSSGENVYVRYRVGTNNFSASTAVVQATGSGTSWTATLPAQACGSTVHYYVYTSTRTLAQINSDSETDRSLATLRYDDNGGTNYSSTLPAAITYYADADADGFGNPLVTQSSCTGAPVGYVSNNTDCNDSQIQYFDGDGDGFGVNVQVACGVLNTTDCDDDNEEVYQLGNFYVDADGDNYSTSETTTELCYGASEPIGYSAINLGLDCDDTNVAIYQLGNFYVDADGDNYSTSETTTELCYGATEPAGYSAINLGLDCDDTIAAVNPGMAEIPYDGLDNDCDTVLDNGFAPFVSTMLNCGTTLSNIGSLISCVGTVNAAEYRFEVTGPNGTVTIDRNVQYFSLTQLADYQYATTYSVRVMLRRAGQTNFVGYYSSPCSYSTPPVTSPVGGVGSTQLQSYCNGTLPTLATLIATTSLPGVTGYRFRVTNTETGTVQTLDRSLHWFSLTMLNEFHYGTTYLVDVAVRTTAAFPAEPTFGAPCFVTTPALPSLTAYCGGVVPNKGITIPTTSLNRATLYRFEVTRYSDNTLNTILSVQQIDRTQHWFNFNLVTDYVPNGVYGVRVSVMTSGSFPGSSVLGQFLYGDTCIITSPNIAREATPVATSRFEAVGYPNPYDYEFGIKLDTTSDSMVSIKVYDMIGKLIEQREVAPIDIPVQAIGERYPTGVYNVVVSQDGNAKSLRMIKR